MTDNQRGLLRTLYTLEQGQTALQDACAGLQARRITPEEISWLKVLIASYDLEHDWDRDEDPSATNEMLSACRALHAALVEQYPACLVCLFALAGEDGFCDTCRPRIKGATDANDPNIPF